MSEKLNWIFEAEDRLGLIKRRVDSIRPRNDEVIIPLNAKMENKTENSTKSSTRIWDKLLWPRFLSTSWLIIAFYFLLGVIDLGFLIISFVLL
jgi:hypothetical protein